MARTQGNLWLWLGLGAAALWFMAKPAGAVSVPGATMTTQSPTEYWFDPSTNELWYEFGGVLNAPKPGMRPASTYEVSSYWPPRNHPEFSAGGPESTYWG